MNAERVLQELRAFAREHPEIGFIQFRTLVSARQYRRLYTLIDRYLPAGAKVLDWGCGNGHATYALTSLGHRPTAFSLDPAPPVARLVPEAKWVTSSGPERLPFEDATFDAVLSVGVLEHVRETGGTEAASLREIRRVLKPGGVFLCYHFPNRFSYIEAVAKWLPGMHHHAFRFTERDIRTLCAAEGFEVAEVGRYGALPRNPWQAAPTFLGNSGLVAGVWEALDAIGEIVARPLVQNYWFVARRPAARDG